jgi:hypothetical protein
MNEPVFDAMSQVAEVSLSHYGARKKKRKKKGWGKKTYGRAAKSCELRCCWFGSAMALKRKERERRVQTNWETTAGSAEMDVCAGFSSGAFQERGRMCMIGCVIT